MFLLSSIEKRVSSHIDAHSAFFISGMCSAAAAAVAPLSSSVFGVLQAIPLGSAMFMSVARIVQCNSDNATVSSVIETVSVILHWLWMVASLILAIKAILSGCFSGLLLLIPLAVCIYTCHSGDGISPKDAAQVIVRVLLPLVIFAMFKAVR